MNFVAIAKSGFGWVLQTSWQAAVLVLLVMIARTIFRNKLSPAWRYGLWLLVMVRLLMPAAPQSAASIFNLAKWMPGPAIAVAPVQPGTQAAEARVSELKTQAKPANDRTFPGPAPLTEVRAASHPAGAVSTMSGRPHRPTDWFGIACAVWLGGVCLLGFRLAWANVRFSSRLARHLPVADAAIIRLARECANILRISRPVSVIETEEVESPAVCGLWKKRLLAPDGVFERFSSEELRHIFLHELAHIKRRDIEVNWLAALLQIVHWFNPVFWLAFAWMRADRELATDALALACVAEAENVSYGETILKVVEHLARRAAQPGLVGIAESKAGLSERLRSISRFRAAKPWRWAAIGITVVVAGVGLTGAKQTHQPEATGREGAPAISRDSSNAADQFQVMIGERSFDAEMKRSPYIAGTVVDAEGRQVAGAQLALVKPGSRLYLTGTPRLFNREYPHLMGEAKPEGMPWNYCTAGARGRFILNDLAGASSLLAVQESGLVQIETDQFSTNMTVKLEPWGRIQGSLWHYDEAVTNEFVSAKFAEDETTWGRGPGLETKTDDHGRFSFDFVPPGRFSVLGAARIFAASEMLEVAVVKSGETTLVKIGGSGRPVVGKFEIRNPHVKVEWGRRGDFYIFSTMPRPPSVFKTEEDYKAWIKRPEIQRAIDNSHNRPLEFAKDGSFRIDQLDRGTYEMDVTIFDPHQPNKCIASYEGSFNIPAGKPNTREAFDLGVIDVLPKP